MPWPVSPTSPPPLPAGPLASPLALPLASPTADARGLCGTSQEVRRLQIEARTARGGGRSPARRLVDAKLDSCGTSVYERLHMRHAQTAHRIEARREELQTEQACLERWDGTLVAHGDVSITRRGSLARQSLLPSDVAIARAAAGAPSDEPPTLDMLLSVAAEPAHERLHRRGSFSIQRTRERHEHWQAVVRERHAGKTGAAPLTTKQLATEAEACDRLWRQACERQERQWRREAASSAAGRISPPPLPPRAVKAVGDEAAGEAACPAARDADGDPGTRADTGEGEGRSTATAIELPCTDGRPVGASSPRQSPGVVTPTQAVASGAQMHAEAMRALREREQAVQLAREQAEIQAAELAHRTAGSVPVTTAAQRERLYRDAIEQQARQERLAIQRQQELRAAELEGTTFSPDITPRAARVRRPNGISTEQWLLQWEAERQGKLEEMMLRTTAVSHSSAAESHGSTRHRSRHSDKVRHHRGAPHHTPAEDRARTVETI